LTADERARLARILGMLGSEYPGERASAGLQAEAFRKRHGLTWEAMLSLPAAEVAPEPVWTPPPAPTHDPYAHAPSWARPDTRPPDPPSTPEIEPHWTGWHTLAMCLAPGIFFSWMFVSEAIRLLRWIRLYGFVAWVREKTLIYAYVLTVTFGTVLFLRYVTGVR
jgi:hypothetical protein